MQTIVIPKDVLQFVYQALNTSFPNHGVIEVHRFVEVSYFVSAEIKYYVSHDGRYRACFFNFNFNDQNWTTVFAISITYENYDEFVDDFSIACASEKMKKVLKNVAHQTFDSLDNDKHEIIVVKTYKDQ